ncbi:hypothetical protein [Hwangdonia lutea]|uniref:Uncharacterized protein n=1 Tax=Hwangdonia lutea TaxID=3075823 RepID=A0AA97HQX1_9FLAO|nr:hypothetical protein [Hwangdonia sp. SCSIO 19198]WOD43425.1 hypothetical protein RNZ46_15660 [Hwangdonia sp. SCSIO 19198]
MLISSDLIFIALHTFYVYGIIDGNSNFSLEKDFGYSEIFQYLKEYWSFLLLFFVFVGKRKLTYLIWSVFFLYLLLDDSLSIHENVGEYLANYLNIQPKFNLRSVDFGEVLISFLVGLTFLVLFIFTYIKEGIEEKLITRCLAILVFALAFFGIFIDVLHIALPFGENKLAVIEDGGEMIVMSILLWYNFNLKYKLS